MWRPHLRPDGLSSAAEIAAPVEVVFDHASAFERMPAWQPDLQVVSCLRRDAEGRPSLIYTELETALRRAEATLSITYDEPHRVSWTMTEGNVPAFEGAWHLTPLGDSLTRAEYHLVIDFGSLGRLVRGAAARALGGAAISSMPIRLKNHVEALEGA